jgi:hypothetical protein
MLSLEFFRPSMASTSQGPRTFRHVCRMSAGRAVYHTWDIRLPWCCCGSQVN